jgi:hypothetical protein
LGERQQVSELAPLCGYGELADGVAVPGAIDSFDGKKQAPASLGMTAFASGLFVREGWIGTMT